MAFTWSEETVAGKTLVKKSHLEEAQDNVDQVIADSPWMSAYPWPEDYSQGITAGQTRVGAGGRLAEIRAAVDYLDDNKDCSTHYTSVNSTNKGTVNSTQNSGYCPANDGPDNSSEDSTYNGNNKTDNSPYCDADYQPECGVDNSDDCADNADHNSPYCGSDLDTEHWYADNGVNSSYDSTVCSSDYSSNLGGDYSGHDGTHCPPVVE